MTCLLDRGVGVIVRRLAWGLLLLWLMTSSLAPATGGEETYQPTYTEQPTVRPEAPRYLLAVHPLHNPQLLFSKYQPLVDFLNARATGFSLALVASRDYRTFEQKLYARKFHFALPNPMQTLASQRHGYRIVGKMGDDNQFRGIIIVRRDSHISSVSDLAGAALSFPSITALAATMMPKYFLHTKGLNLAKNDLRYVGSQESAIMNVYLGKTAAAGTWPLPWEMLLKSRPELSKDLEVKWTTPRLVNNGLVVRDDVPEEHIRQFMEALLSMPQDAQAREVLAGINICCFEPASAATYQPVRDFLERYYKSFPAEEFPIEGKP